MTTARVRTVPVSELPVSKLPVSELPVSELPITELPMTELPTTGLPITEADFVADPYPYFAQARAVAPVQWHETLQLWLAFDHPSANAVLRSRTLGRIWSPRWPEIAMPAFELIHRNSLLEHEPPEHTRLRRLVAAAFGRGHVERLRPRVLALAAELAEDLQRAADANGGLVDLISVYAEPLPVQVIAELLGVPRTDWGLLRPWSNAIVKMYEYDIGEAERTAAERAAAEFVDYLRSMIELRRGALTDDLVSSLITETDSDGARLTEDELVTTCTLLLNAGHEASVNALGNGIATFAGYPDQWQRVVAEPTLVDTAVEEMIRYDPPLQLFERTAFQDTEIGGVTVAKGQKIAALLGSANRDGQVFADADRFDIARTNNPHLGFGAGIHFCVGAPLARIELQTSLRTLIDRFPGLAVAADPEPFRRFVLRGREQLSVSLI